MRRKFMPMIILLTFMLALFAGCGAVNEAFYTPMTFEISDSLSEQKQEELRERIEQFFRESGGFSGAVLVAQGGDVLISEAFGIADPETGIRNTLDTPFPISFMTQMFTGTAVLFLEMEGKLNTSDTLDKFFSGHENLRYLTVQNLLTMSGGFGGHSYFRRVFIETPDEIRQMSVADFEPYIIERWNGGALNDASGTLDYWLLGRVIEQSSGMTWEKFIQTRIFDPIGMQNSGFFGRHESAMPLHIPIQMIEAYERIMGAEHFPYFLASYASEGSVSSANDLNLWLDANFGGNFFSEYILDQINDGNFNYGWRFHDSGAWYQLGAPSLFNSGIIYDPSSDTRIIVLSNLSAGNGEAVSLANLIAEVLLGIRF